MTHRRAVLLMLVVTLMWSTAGVVTRHLHFASGYEVTFWRTLFTALSLVVILPLVKGKAVFYKIRHAKAPFWISAVCWSVMFTAFMLALTLTTVGNVLVTMSVGPLMTALVARVVIGHKIPLRTWLAIAMAGVGIAYMFASQLDAGTISVNGTLIAVCVPIAAAVNWTVAQYAHDHGIEVDLMTSVWLGAVLSSIFTFPFALPLRGDLHDLQLLGFLGVFQLAIPCLLSVRCAQVLRAPEVSLLQLMEIVFGILLAWLGAGEVPGNSVFLGGGFVISALVINEWLGWRRAER